jgi:hypothetical protein
LIFDVVGVNIEADMKNYFLDEVYPPLCRCDGGDGMVKRIAGNKRLVGRGKCRFRAEAMFDGFKVRAGA